MIGFNKFRRSAVAELREVTAQELLAGEKGYDPYITMFTAQQTMQRGWLASQADMLANDWVFC